MFYLIFLAFPASRQLRRGWRGGEPYK